MFGRITSQTKTILQKQKMDYNQLIRKQLILDRVNLIERVGGGGIKTSWVKNSQNDAYSRLESIRTLFCYYYGSTEEAHGGAVSFFSPRCHIMPKWAHIP